MKKLFLLAVVLVLLVVGAVVAVVIYADRAVKIAVEKGGTYALGVETTLGGADVGFLSASLGLRDLKIANPPGYKSDRFLGLGSGKVSVWASSLRGSVIEVPTLSLDTITLNLERATEKANYRVILDNLKRLESGEAPSKDTRPSGEQKRFVIRHLSIREVHVNADLVPMGGDLTRISIPIESIELRDVGTAGRGVPLAELADIIIKALLVVVSEKGAQLLPPEILGDLRSGLAQLRDLDSLGVKVQSAMGEKAQKMIDEKLGTTVDDAKKKAEEAIDGATKKVEDGLKNLLPGKK
ncbi:MAG: hypothetical protein KF787_02430 [Phycisphaeraceae bacterium]|nr:hypothetical protein [Phycisphaerae bacterium]MBX3391482.1 hypothetical protein [Phycisphaeraceae bacterium]